MLVRGEEWVVVERGRGRKTFHGSVIGQVGQCWSQSAERSPLETTLGERREAWTDDETGL